MADLMIVLILTAFACFALFICMFMIYRNDWVFKVRTEVLHKQGYEIYSALPSYEIMLRSFWVWDVNKFLPDEYRKVGANG
ncbi:hypothetical protein [Yersinia alsatica]|uniref:hypothetical protein n=1 Tax=Yersinia alsatica TaxID=2890317 RepID=UPI00119EBF55|nr:hypothetical protein [Yersinia alsatica]